MTAMDIDKTMDKETRQKRADVVVQMLKTLFPQVKCALHYATPLELLIAVILSAQCTDKKVNEVTEKLFRKYPTPQAYLNADYEEFCQDIRQTGFYRNKAKNVLATVKKIADEYGGEVPHTMTELITLSGVARKTASIVLGEVFGITEGIAVDTHVIRLSQKFGLTVQKDQGKIEKDLMDVVPKEEWRGFTLRMGNYGRQYSPAHKKSDMSDPVSKVLIGNGLL